MGGTVESTPQSRAGGVEAPLPLAHADRHASSPCPPIETSAPASDTPPAQGVPQAPKRGCHDDSSEMDKVGKRR